MKPNAALNFNDFSTILFLFQFLSEEEESQITMLRGIFDMWKTHQQMMVVLVDKLLKTQIIQCSAVANWLFSKEMVPEFTKLYVWEMLHLTIRCAIFHKIIIRIWGRVPSPVLGLRISSLSI